jgi:hypothetical protein
MSAPILAIYRRPEGFALGLVQEDGFMVPTKLAVTGDGTAEGDWIIHFRADAHYLAIFRPKQLADRMAMFEGDDPKLIRAAAHVLRRLGVAEKARKAFRRYGREVVTEEFVEAAIAQWEAAL